jgi:hypothetical protein
MPYDSERLEELRERTIKWIFDAIFHGMKATAEEFRWHVHRLGTLNKLLERDQ